MRIGDDVQAITQFKSRAAEVVREAADGRTVVITQNGEARAVLIGAREYDRWRQTMAMLKILAQGQADVEAGRVVSQDQAFARARKAAERAARDG